MFYFHIYNTLVVSKRKAKTNMEVLKFNKMGWRIYEYLLYIYYTMLEMFIIKGSKIKGPTLLSAHSPGKNSAST